MKVHTSRGEMELNTLFRWKVITKLKEVGVPAGLSGYECLSVALMKSLQDPTILKGVTKRLYKEVALETNSTASRVERVMRSSIEVAFNRCSYEILNREFGNCIDPNKGKPTNVEFISTLSNNIAIEILLETGVDIWAKRKGDINYGYGDTL